MCIGGVTDPGSSVGGLKGSQFVVGYDDKREKVAADAVGCAQC